MRNILACVITIWALGAASAHAQTSVWTDPTGTFSLSYEALGWTPIAPADLQPEEGDVLLLEHNGFQAGGQMRMCGVRSVPVPQAPRGMAQSRANLAVTNRSQADFENVTRAALSDFSRSDMNGVAVAAFSFEADQYLNYWRLFYLARGDETLQVNISCGMTRPATEAEIANVNALLQTLQINGVPQ